MSNEIDYKKGYNIAKIIVVAVTLICTGLSIYVIKSGLDQAEEERETIFVTDVNNTLLVALANDMQLNRTNEAKAVLKRLHHYLFSLTPTADNINGSIANAENISDESVLQYVEKQKERGWYNKMIAESISTEFMCDSIDIEDSDRKEANFKAILYGKQSVIYSDRIEFHSVVTICYLEDDYRTVENPNGLSVRNWNIVKDDIIKTVKRKRQKIDVVINDSIR